MNDHPGKLHDGYGVFFMKCCSPKEQTVVLSPPELRERVRLHCDKCGKHFQSTIRPDGIPALVERPSTQKP